MLTTEIERKFLVRCIPDRLEGCVRAEIEQGYLALDPDGTEVRIRRVGSEHWQTVKSGSGLMRLEFQMALASEWFEALWPLTEGRRVEKTRIDIPIGALKAELDIYAGPLRGLFTVEVEFDSVEASRGFVPPAWFGREITAQEGYRNRHLARFGLPEEDS